MKIIKIEPYDNGAHANQTSSSPFPVPDGYALIPDDMPIPDTFPFVNIEVEGDDPPVVTKMTAGVVPPPEPEPAPEPAPADYTAALTAAATAFALTAVNIPDAQALDMVVLFPTWEDVLADGVQLAAGRVINGGGQLYRVVQDVTPQAHQAPHDAGMLAVYRPIDQEHVGTLDDPIPWVYGMDCLTGRYYSHEGVTYLCKGDMIPCVWEPGTPGLWQWEEIKN